jgi:tetratricopeptide (TPR) repeat protein
MNAQNYRNLSRLKNMKQVLVLFALSFWALGQFQCSSSGNAHNDPLYGDTTLSLVVQEWTKRIAAYPENADYYVGRAEALIESKKMKFALRDIEKAMRLDPINPKHYAMKGDLEMAINETFKASKTYEEATTLFPKDVQGFINLGRFNMLVRKYPESQKALNKALELEPGAYEAHFLGGLVLKEMGDTVLAAEAFERCLIIDPLNANALIQLGNLYSSKNDQKALDYYNKAIDLDDLNEEAFYGRGRLQQELGNLEEAIKDYQSCIDINSAHYLAYYNTGYILFSRNNFDRAIEHFRIAVNFAPDYVKGHYMLGLCSEGKGNKEQAYVFYRKCLQLDPEFTLAQAAIDRIDINQ